MRWPSLIAIAVVIAVVAASGVRASSRLEVWGNVVWILKRGWLTGWGFFPISGSFREHALGGQAMGSLALTDLHSTWMDWLVRFGLVGLLAISPLVIWVVRRTFSNPASWKLWTLILAAFAGSLQSAESLAVMSLLGFVWLMRLNEEEGVS